MLPPPDFDSADFPNPLARAPAGFFFARQFALTQRARILTTDARPDNAYQQSHHSCERRRLHPAVPAGWRYLVGGWMQPFNLWPLQSACSTWQLLTYGFLHGGSPHIFFNMFAVFMFGSESSACSERSAISSTT
jgi:hypothetical protein